ncbi:hypothetical protein HDC34_002181 [Pseudoclavibacter sp. JAI123]|uniref:hypothetical protein n=1 Tax=Pseudoclavibacter sp. JAI123 TaxID=2723065 RepID=UPI0015C73EE8|nr:hypothetical protein [Pseudoclavibacter sp. JAI123]NYF13887.1 hypothetical protein [Pseudoclavibacter sp. JAI123]
MTSPSDWIEHRRGDGELLGWMRPHGDGFVVIDLLGRECSGELDWFEAETLIEETGIGYLADPYELRLGGCEWVRVRITEVSVSQVRVKLEDWGDVNVPTVEHVLAFPPGDDLRRHEPHKPGM